MAPLFRFHMATLDNSSGKHRGSRAPKHVNARAKAAMMAAVDHCLSDNV